MFQNGKPSSFLELVGYLHLNPYVSSLLPADPAIGRDKAIKEGLHFLRATKDALIFKTDTGGKNMMSLGHNPEEFLVFKPNYFEVTLDTLNPKGPRMLFYYRTVPDCDPKDFDIRAEDYMN